MPAITLVQQANNFNAAGASTTATLAAVPTAGNLLVAVAEGSDNANADTITGWTLAINDPIAGSTYNLSILYRVAVAGDAAAVQVTQTASSEVSLWIGEYRYPGAWSLDVTAKDNQNSSTGGTSRATGLCAPTAQVVELAVAAVGQGNTSSAQTWTNDFLNVHDGSRIHVAHKSLASITTPTSTMSWTTTRIAGGCIAVFKPVGYGRLARRPGRFRR